MPTEAPPKRETWEDWLPPEGRDEGLVAAEPMFTRDELVTELHSLGHKVSPRDLVYWQTKGVIPYPVRQKRHGRSIAVYPAWMPQVIHTLRNLKEQGYALREIGPLLRDTVFHTFAPQPQTPEQAARQARRRARRALYPLVSDLEPRIRSFARIHEQLHDDRIVGAEIRLVREDGTAETYVFPTGDSENTSPSVEPLEAVKDMV